MAFSPDGREVALASEGLVEVWDVEAPPRPIRSFRGHAGFVYAVAFSPDGRYLASGGLDRTLRLWDRATGNEIRAFYGHEGFVRGLAFSPDGRWLLSASEDCSLKLWEVASGRPLADFHGHQSFASCVAFSPDGRLVASGGQDHAVKLWSATRRAPLTFTGHDGAVRGLEFLPESQRLVSGAGIIRPEAGSSSGTRRRASRSNPPSKAAPRSTPSLCIVTAGASPRPALVGWDRAGLGSRYRPARMGTEGTSGRGRRRGIQPGRTVARLGWPDDTAVGGGEVTLWDAETGGRSAISGSTPPVSHGVAFSPDSRWLASGWGDGIVRIWDTKDPASEARELPGHAGQVKRVVFLPDGRLASAGGRSGSRSSEFGEVKIWDLSTGRVLDLRGHTAIGRRAGLQS